MTLAAALFARIAISLVPFLFCALPAASQAVGGGTVAADEAVHGTLVPRGQAGWGTQYDEWRFTPHDTGMVTIRVESSGFTPMVDFGTAEGSSGFRQSGWFVDYQRESAQLIRFPAARKPHLIRVGTDSTGRGGAYTLRIIRGAPAQPIAAGQAVTGSLDGPDPETSDGPRYNSYHFDDWSVTPATGDSLVIRMRADLYDPRIAFGTVEAGRFREIARARSTPERVARLAVEPEAGRRYVVRVGGTDPQSGLSGYGTYTLHVGTAADSVGTLRAAFPGVLSRVAPDPGVEEWRFIAVSGDSITVQVDSLGFATSLQVGTMQGDAFTPVAQREGIARLPTRLVIATEPGREYTIRVRSRESGAYTLRVIRGGAGDAPAASATTSSPPR